MNRKRFVMYIKEHMDTDKIIELVALNSKYAFSFTKDCVQDFINDGELVVNDKTIKTPEEFYDFMTH